VSLDELTARSDIEPLMESWKRHLRAKRRSDRTVQSYEETVRQLDAFLADAGMARQVANIRREHVEAWIVHLLDRFRPATAAVRLRSLQQSSGGSSTRARSTATRWSA
jgi:site-specific recombinase XerD